MMQLRARFEDKCGHPLAGGSVFAFEVGTSTPKDTFKDADGTIPNTHPIKLDYRGEADIFLLTGRYRFVVYSCTGVKIYDVDNVGEWLGPISADNVIDDGKTQHQVNIELKQLLAEEEQRATSAETSLNEKITHEESRAINAEQGLNGAILGVQTDLNSKIFDEKNRAIAAEQNLQIQITTGTGNIKYFSTEAELLAFVPTTTDPKQAYAFDTKKNYLWVLKSGSTTEYEWRNEGTSVLDLAKSYTNDKTKNISETPTAVLDERRDKNLNTYRYTTLDGKHFLIGLNGSVQDNFKALYDAAKNIPTFQKNSILAELRDSVGQVFSYYDISGNPYFLSDVYIAGKSLNSRINEANLQNRYQGILMEKFPSIKSLVPIALKSEDNLIKRMPAAIKTPTGLVYFYHKQIAGFDGDLTGSELWKAIITIDDNLNVNVVSRELFLAPDQPRGIVKHPMLGRTSDGRIILMYEKRLETSDNYTRYQCYSNDHGLTFTTPTLVTPSGTNPAGVSGYSALGTTGTITTAKNGRLIVPMYTTGGTCYCIYSDDDGVSWRFSGWVNTSQVSGYEPSISLDMDDNLIMDVRPKTATYRLKAKSYDNGETWKFFEGQQIPSATNQGVIFRDKEIGAMIQANDAMQSNSRTKYSLFISYDNAVTYPFVYMPFSETWYGGYSQIIKWKDGIYIISIEYADSFISVNNNENAGLLVLSLKEVLKNVSRN